MPRREIGRRTGDLYGIKHSVLCATKGMEWGPLTSERDEAARGNCVTRHLRQILNVSVLVLGGIVGTI